jgi:tetratricopeptide (TPR) repeat protein
MFLDEDPERALAHARFAKSRASRIAAIREAVGIAAYNAGEWQEALGELRAARRMRGGHANMPVMADCERALGRPEKALELAKQGADLPLDKEDQIELLIVAAGARRDLGQVEEAVVSLQTEDLDPNKRDEWSARLFYAYADNLAAADRKEEALTWFLHADEADPDGETDAAERAVELANPEETVAAAEETVEATADVVAEDSALED